MRLNVFGATTFVSLLLFGTVALAQTRSESFTVRKENWARCEKNGSAEFKADIIDASINSCTAIIESGRENTFYTALAFYNRGLLYQFKNDFDRALADYNQSISLDPHKVIAYINRGEIYYDKRDYDRAIAEYSQSINLVANNAIAFFHRAHAYEAIGNYDLAMADYDQAIRLVPTYAVVFLERGTLYARRQACQRAIMDFNEAIRLNAALYNAFINRGFCSFELGKMADAENDFAQATKLNPKNPYLSLWLYLAHIKMGRTDLSELSAISANLDLREWPGPVIKLYLGRTTEDQVMASVSSIPGAEQACEASFYVGEYKGLGGDKTAAKLLMEQATKICPHDKFGISFAAAAELKRLQ